MARGKDAAVALRGANAMRFGGSIVASAETGPAAG
jgi:hypothetical protein